MVRHFTVVQLHWAGIPYYEHSQAINQVYCARHGYTYFDAEPDDVDPFRRLYHRVLFALDKLAPPVMSEVPEPEEGQEPEVPEVLEESAVLYLDADAYFVDHNRTLEDIFDAYFQDENTAILFPENGFDSKRRFPGNEVNTGVFLIREHEQSRPMLQAWWDAYTPALATISPTASDQERYLKLNDQEVFNKKVRGLYLPHINIARNPEFGGIDGNFIRHQILIPDIEREQRIGKDRQRLLG